MKRPKLRGEAVFERDSRPTQHVIDRHVREEYEKDVRRTSNPPAEPMIAVAQMGTGKAVPAEQ